MNENISILTETNRKILMETDRKILTGSDSVGFEPADRKMLELYIHIPFCVQKCAYCDFLSFPADQQSKKIYVEHLISEVLSYCNLAEKYRVSSIFIGGGTPSCLQPEWIRKIMEAVRSTFQLAEDAEITMECNPGTLTERKLSIYKEAGINRLSIGLQSTDNEELKLLGRIHTYEEFLASYQLARSAGFSNINIDLISSLPGQSKEKFESTLRKVIALQPEHISAYSLIIEPGTPFYDKYENDVLRREEGEPTESLPDEDEEVETGKMTRRILRENGYHRYEISNYARPGKECRHNIGYWIGTEYLGLGLGASGLIGDVRYRNHSDMKKYLEAVEGIAGNQTADIRKQEADDQNQTADTRKQDADDQKQTIHVSNLTEAVQNLTEDDSADSRYHNCLWESSEILTEKNKMEEFMFLGLRMTKGVSETEFMSRFHRSIHEVYGKQLDMLVGEDLMQKAPETLKSKESESLKLKEAEALKVEALKPEEIKYTKFNPAESLNLYKKENNNRESACRYALTEQGMDLANYCMAEFLFDD